MIEPLRKSINVIEIKNTILGNSSKVVLEHFIVYIIKASVGHALGVVRTISISNIQYTKQWPQ